MKTTPAVIVRHLRCAKSPMASFEARRLQAAVTQEAAGSSLSGRHFYKASGNNTQNDGQTERNTCACV